MRLLLAILFLLFVAPAAAQQGQGMSQAMVVSSCGGGALPSGAVNQLTMDTTGRLCSHKTGSGVSPPVISVAPVASGSLTVGSTLSTTNGTWTNSPTGFAYQWRRGGVNISGATSSTYVTVTADGGTSVGCQVTATNAGGSNSAASNVLAITAAAPTSVWSASDVAANSATLSNGNLTVVATTSTWQSFRGTISHTSGKFYVEFLASTAPSSNTSGFGIADAGFNPTSYISNTNYSAGSSNSGGVSLLSGSGFTFANNTGLVTPVLNDVIQVAVDFTAGKFWYGYNNTWLAVGNPATGANPLFLIVSPALGLAFFPAMSVDFPASGAWTLQPTAASQKYAAPAGFSPWN